MLDIIISFVTVAGVLPFGILLALGRRSELGVVRSLSIAFIELWRGVPLLTVLFMSAVMLPLFLPHGVSIDRLLVMRTGELWAHAIDICQATGRPLPQLDMERMAALCAEHRVDRIVVAERLVHRPRFGPRVSSGEVEPNRRIVRQSSCHVSLVRQPTRTCQ